METRLAKIEADVLENRREIFDLKTRIAVAENNIVEIKGSLESIKNNTNWIIRLILGAIILAIVGFVTSGGLNQ